MTPRKARKRAARSGARPVGVDVFAGAGGMSLGFEQAGFDVLACVDNDPVHLAVHHRNLPLSTPICHDVASVSAKQLHDAIRQGWGRSDRDGKWDGTVDCVFGGPSCQGFSDMGQQRADDTRNNLIFAFANVVTELKPRAFVMENVPGMLSPKVNMYLKDVQKIFKEAGYELQGDVPASLDASHYGVPQRRQRIFLIGVRKGEVMPLTPKPILGPTVAEALDDLPNVEEYEALISSDALRLDYRAAEKMTRLMSDYVASLRKPYGLEYERVWDQAVLTGCQRTNHTKQVQRQFSSLNQGDQYRPSRMMRLTSDGQSQTLRAGSGRDHGSYTAPRPVHHNHNRVITVREAARLHSFPDWFAFNSAKWHALREIGNAVPPRLAAAVARTICDALGFSRLTAPTRLIELGPESLLNHSLTSAADHFGYSRSLLSKDVRSRPPVRAAAASSR